MGIFRGSTRQDERGFRGRKVRFALPEAQSVSDGPCAAKGCACSSRQSDQDCVRESPTTTSPPSCVEHAGDLADEQSPVGRRDPDARRDRRPQYSQDGVATTTLWPLRGEWSGSEHHTSHHRLPELHPGHEQSREVQERPNPVHGGTPQPPCQSECHANPVAEAGPPQDLLPLQDRRDRPGRLRDPQFPHLPGVEGDAGSILPVGGDHSPRGAVQPADGAICDLAGAGEDRGEGRRAKDSPQSQDAKYDGVGAPRQDGRGRDQSTLPGQLSDADSDDGGDDGSVEKPPAGGERHEGGQPLIAATTRESPRPGDGRSPECERGWQFCGSERLQREVKDKQEVESQPKPLEDSVAQHLEREAGALVPSLFQQLLGEGRPHLMEVCCDSNSALSSAIQETVGTEQAATRCSLYNACDLATDPGVRLVLECLEVQRPQVVWMKPPAASYSPLSNMTPPKGEQQEALQQKRLATRRLLIGCACVLHHCIQQGIHVVLVLDEKSMAWRMPLIQDLKKKYSLHEVTTSGCAVNRRNKQGRFVKPGWRMLTSHSRLAKAMDLPCRCPKNYSHGAISNGGPKHSEEYTPEYVSRVAKYLSQEFDSEGCARELTGQSHLPEVFGEGSCCTCAELQWPNVRTQTCASCLIEPTSMSQARENPQGNKGQGPQPPNQAPRTPVTQEPEEAHYEASSSQDNRSEEHAKTLLERRDFSYPSCEKLVQELRIKNHGRNRNLIGQGQETMTLGMYAYGNHYGVTRRTEQLPCVTRYLNEFLRHKCPNHEGWCSLVVSRNTKLPTHRDLHNLPGSKNLVVGLGAFKQGELWLEEPQPEQTDLQTAQVRHDGTLVNGQKKPIWRHPVAFDPKAWHGSCDWSGERYVLAAYSSRGLLHATGSDEAQLHACGFPKYKMEHAMVLSERREVRERERAKADEKIKKQLYLLHSATGHGSTKHLVQALKRRGAPPRVLELAKEFKCSVCAERPRVQPRHLASLEPLPPKWHTISADIGHFHHAETNEHAQFMVIIDECSRFRTARILTKGSKQQPTAAACLQYLREGWTQYFGNPRCLRLDPGGSFRSQSVQDFCDRNDILLDIIPGEAHWQIGVCEQAVQGLQDHDGKAEPGFSRLTS